MKSEDTGQKVMLEDFGRLNAAKITETDDSFVQEDDADGMYEMEDGA